MVLIIRVFWVAVAMLWLNLGAACRATVAGVARAPDLILPLGDSITRGKDDDGYRSSLAKLLMARRIPFHFVGSLSNGPWWSRERAHEGHNGAQVDHLLAMIDERMRTYRPDVVLLMIGANDLEANADLAELPARYQKLLDRIVAARPDVKVLVSEVSLIRVPEFDRLAREFNPKIQAMATAMAKRGHRVRFVPMHDVLSPRDLDAVDHPDFFGNQKIAARWMDYLEPWLKPRD